MNAVATNENPAFVLLAHEPPNKLKDLILAILASGCDLYVHHDLNASNDLIQTVPRWDIDDLPGNIYFAKRVRVGWGEWSICQATLNCLRLARMNNYGNATRFFLISGSCMPTKPLDLLRTHFATHNTDFIEAVDAERFIWVAGGIQNERWEYHHIFNYRSQRERFYWFLRIQKLLGLKRKLPENYHPYIGSQWWCLRTSTIDTLLKALDSNPRIEKFYATTCVPDECFFQTLVRNLIPDEEIDNELLTQYSFNSWGVPRVYYDDDYGELLEQPKFFARKISHRSIWLKEQLRQAATLSTTEFDQRLARELQQQQALPCKYKSLIKHKATLWNSPLDDRTHHVDYAKRIPGMVYFCLAHEYDKAANYLHSAGIQTKSFHTDFLMNYSNFLRPEIAVRVVGAFKQHCLQHNGYDDILVVLPPEHFPIIDDFKWNSRACFIWEDLDCVAATPAGEKALQSFHAMQQEDHFISLVSLSSHLLENNDVVDPPIHLIVCNHPREAHEYAQQLTRENGSFQGHVSTLKESGPPQNSLSAMPYYYYLSPYECFHFFAENTLPVVVHYHPACEEILWQGSDYNNFHWAIWEINGRNKFNQDSHWPGARPYPITRLSNPRMTKAS